MFKLDYIHRSCDKHRRKKCFEMLFYLYIQTEHYDEERASFDGYNQIADPNAGSIAAYLVNIYRKVIERCLLKHSKRCTSKDVSNIYYCIAIMIVCLLLI